MSAIEKRTPGGSGGDAGASVAAAPESRGDDDDAPGDDPQVAVAMETQ